MTDADLVPNADASEWMKWNVFHGPTIPDGLVGPQNATEKLFKFLKESSLGGHWNPLNPLGF